ncbi:MAG: hypothetical protein ACOH2V_01140 [Candidatus Saccharimonadaceae bacterium]
MNRKDVTEEKEEDDVQNFLIGRSIEIVSKLKEAGPKAPISNYDWVASKDENNKI